MKLCVAQFKPFPGDIDRNIVRHLEMINAAIAHGVDLIVFSELSLTGYEPTLAESLVLSTDDQRLKPFQAISDQGNISVGIGLPTRSTMGIHISMIFFRPLQPYLVYSKHYLHSDEDPFFVAGANLDGIVIKGEKIALAICYEISIAEHTAAALQTSPKYFVASVAKSSKGVEVAHRQLITTARQYNVTVLMSNAIGPSDGGICGGRSVVIDQKGNVQGELDDTTEGLLIYDGDSVQHALC